MNGHNEQHKDEYLLHTVEQVLAQPDGTVYDPQSLPGFSVRLASTVPQPDAAFADRLEARLVAAAAQRKETPMKMIASQRPSTDRRVGTSSKRRAPHSIVRIAAVCSAALVLLVGLVAATPPARAWAQDTVSDLLAYFGFARGASESSLPVASGAVFRAEPNTMPTQPRDDCVTLDTGGTICGAIPNFRTREEAEAQVGFALKMPTYLPPNYLASSMFEVVSPNIIAWGAAKQHVEGQPETICDPSVMLRQVHPVSSDAQPAFIGDAATTPITVSRHAALLIENLQEGTAPCTYGDVTGELGTVTPITNVLVWEQDDIRYYLSADARLGRDELIRIAESLR